MKQICIISSYANKWYWLLREECEEGKEGKKEQEESEKKWEEVHLHEGGIGIG